MKIKELSIGDLAEQAGCTVQLIRHYEKIGLLTNTRRTSGNRRIYTDDQAIRLIFIRHIGLWGWFSLLFQAGRYNLYNVRMVSFSLITSEFIVM